MPRYLITSALPYINGVKHLGNLVGSLLPADVYARFLRQEGHEVLFISGTDEHGTPSELAAAKEGVPVEAFCQRMYQIQSEIYRRFAISFDYFGRSSSSSNHALTVDIFNSLDKQGLIEEKRIKQIYSLLDNRFLPDRYIVGECPRCGYDLARGDQCDGCSSLLEATDLRSPRSVLTPDSPLEVRESSHLYLRLSCLQGEVQQWVDSHFDWPQISAGIAHKWLSEGLHDRCITRDIFWGVPVPRPGFEHKVFYVWFDAPNAYISITQDWAKAHGTDWESWWKNLDGDVQYTQFMAKDNVPFHAIFWPAVLLGTKQPWKLVDILKGFNWLTYEGGKFSTSQKRGIFTDRALDLFPADYWRYYLLSISPESSDSDFKFSEFANVINKDLADVLGNFINRFDVLLSRYWDGKIPNIAPDRSFDLQGKCSQTITEFRGHLHSLSFRKATHSLRHLWSLGNEYFTQREPWKQVKSDPQQAVYTIVGAYKLLTLIAVTSSPIIPSIAEDLFRYLGYDSDPAHHTIEWALGLEREAFGMEIRSPFLLFNKIGEETVASLHQQFGESDK